MDKPYRSLNEYYRALFGRKAAKISLDGGFTCPNRDGTLGTAACFAARAAPGILPKTRRAPYRSKSPAGGRRLPPSGPMPFISPIFRRLQIHTPPYSVCGKHTKPPFPAPI